MNRCIDDPRCAGSDRKRSVCWQSAVLLSIVLACWPAPSFAQGAAPAAPPPAPQNFIVFLWQASPMFFIIMGGLAVYMATVAFNCWTRLRLGLVAPKGEVETVGVLLADEDYKRAYATLKESDSPLARCVTAGVEKLHQFGLEQGFAAAMDQLRSETYYLKFLATPLVVVAILAMPLGFLGTFLAAIFAMQAFVQGGPLQQPAIVEFVNLAILPPFMGLVIAIPAIWYYFQYRNKAIAMECVLEQTVKQMLWRFAASSAERVTTTHGT